MSLSWCKILLILINYSKLVLPSCFCQGSIEFSTVLVRSDSNQPWSWSMIHGACGLDCMKDYDVYLILLSNGLLYWIREMLLFWIKIFDKCVFEKYSKLVLFLCFARFHGFFALRPINRAYSYKFFLMVIRKSNCCKPVSSRAMKMTILTIDDWQTWKTTTK